MKLIKKTNKKDIPCYKKKDPVSGLLSNVNVVTRTLLSF